MKPETTFIQTFFDVAVRADCKDRVAVCDPERQITYADLAQEATQRVAHLARLDLQKGTRVALLQDRRIGLVADILALFMLGCSFTVLSRREGVDSTVDKLKIGKFSCIIADANQWATARSFGEKANLPVLNSAVQNDANSSEFPADILASDEAVIIFTSGSTSKPKAVRISHGNIISNANGIVKMTPFTQADHFLHVMPFSHTNGLMNQLFAPLAHGARITLLDRFVAEDYVAAMALHQPSIVTGVPTILQRLLVLDIPKIALQNLRFIRCGSAPLPPSLQDQIEQKFGVEVIISYGQTEATCTTTSNPIGARLIGSVGKCLDGQEVAVLNTDNDTSIDLGEIGEVAMRGANVSIGYVGAPDFDPKSWQRTGDFGYLNNKGYLFLTGRLKETIIRGGENLSPFQIEAVVLDHPDISAVCVCGAKNTDLGEVPVAFVEASGKTLELGSLNQHIATKLSSSHRLSKLTILPLLPVNLTGKINRKKLSELANPQDGS